MALFTWSNLYSVGNTTMDSHHQKLFDIINKLHADLLAKKGKDALSSTLKELLDYTKYHFGAEEELMKRANYPGFNDQKKAHESFIAQIVQYQNDLNNGKELMVSANITNTLVNWLSAHIAQMDKNYKNYL